MTDDTNFYGCAIASSAVMTFDCFCAHYFTTAQNKIPGSNMVSDSIIQKRGYFEFEPKCGGLKLILMRYP